MDTMTLEQIVHSKLCALLYLIGQQEEKYIYLYLSIWNFH